MSLTETIVHPINARFKAHEKPFKSIFQNSTKLFGYPQAAAFPLPPVVELESESLSHVTASRHRLTHLSHARPKKRDTAGEPLGSNRIH